MIFVKELILSIGNGNGRYVEKIISENYETQSFHLKDVLTTLYFDYDVKIFGSDKEQNLKSIRSYQYHQKLP